MTTTEFSALVTIRDGKLKFLDGSSYHELIGLFGEGEELDLHIEQAGRRRTRQQEKFFHGPVLAAFISLGWAKADAKRELCLRFIPVEHHRPDGTIVIVPGHTATLSVEEYNALIDSSIQLAAENDEVVQDGAEWRAKHRKKATAA